MFAANMMKLKRAGALGPYDIAGSPDLKISVSDVDGPGDTKVVWLTDTSKLGKEKEEDKGRRSPEMRYLSLVGAVLTTMVVWGIVRNIVPRFLHETGFIDQPNAYLGFKEGKLGIYSRSDARHLLSISQELMEGHQLPLDSMITDAQEPMDPENSSTFVNKRADIDDSKIPETLEQTRPKRESSLSTKTRSVRPRQVTG